MEQEERSQTRGGKHQEENKKVPTKLGRRPKEEKEPGRTDSLNVEAPKGGTAWQHSICPASDATD